MMHETDKDNVWIYGRHAALSMLKYQPERVQEILFLENRRINDLDEQITRLARQHVKPRTVPASTFQKCAGKAHQGVAMLCTRTLEGGESEFIQFINKPRDSEDDPLFILAMDRTQDPRNLGACLRVADAFGIDAVIMERRRNAPLSPVAIKTASGAAGVVPLFRVGNMVRILKTLKKMGIWLFAADPSSTTDLYDAKMSGPIALVMGAEGDGLRRLVRETCDYLIKIPMQGVTASLNLSVATGICAAEIIRQRRLIANQSTTTQSIKSNRDHGTNS